MNLSSLDAFAKITDTDFRVRTKSGAILSIVALTFITILFISEIFIYLNETIKPLVYVDTTIGSPLQINLDIEFPKLPCSFISINAMDKTGNNQLNIHDNVFTTRLTKDGNEIVGQTQKEVIGEDKQTGDLIIGNETCGSCYGAETKEFPCCKSCFDVQEAYRQKGWAFTSPDLITPCVKEKFVENLRSQKDEGCRIHGSLYVQRVSGNVNIVPGKFIIQNSRFVIDSDIYDFDGNFNVSHKINKLSFGEEYPGMKNPLDGFTKKWQSSEGSPMYEYYVQVVPTIYQDQKRSINTNQYSVTEYMDVIRSTEGSYEGLGIPGLFIMYELSPVTIEFQVRSMTFIHFFTNLCAIIGGVFTVASLLDSAIYKGINTFKKKVELGKQE